MLKIFEYFKLKILIIKWFLFLPLRYFVNLFDKIWIPNLRINIHDLFQQISTDLNVYFIQIGANDGFTNDKLRYYVDLYKWQGILVEPVPYVFNRLKINYQYRPSLIFENCAISDTPGRMIFYSLKEYDINGKSLFNDFTDYKIDQLGSFDKQTILKHSYMHPDFENLIEEINVNTLSFDDLISKYNVLKIDVLLIDTEGYDYKILNSIDFKKIKPSVLIFEHQHLTRKDYKQIVSMLKKNYVLYIDGWDTVCCLKTKF
jgi:FkbM family methyltransferase